ncbi:hypothetical protein SAMN05444487_102241 [Marininema mesophilum]|uniref:Uncharacterized protein n=1 Tax=Marininema mesophilum TaxID=1048340 RepID=A0A1H2SKH5_9BACL|nr:hypothetical protein [Marininema mesophilum]SDW32017.1 hypothetical protein SAMN05444487_102241 [Marininema mesophilum]
MNVRKMAILFVALFTFMVVSAVPAYAATDYGNNYFKTEDGKYDHTFKATSSEKNVQVYAFEIKKVKISTGEKSDGSSSSLDVRLCNSSSGNCTSWKNLSMAVQFTDMKPGTYYADIRDKYASYYYYGYVNVFVR